MTLTGLHIGSLPMFVLGALAGVAALCVALTARHTRWGHGAVVFAVLVAVASTGIATRTHRVESHPLREVAGRGGEITARVVLRESPTPLQGASYGGKRTQARSVASARLSAVRIDGRWAESSGCVLLLVPTRHWSGLLVGQVVRIEAAAIPPRGGGLLVAVLSLHGRPEQLARAPSWQWAAEHLRDGLRAVAVSVLSPDAAGLLPGLVVGETGGLADTVQRDFEDAGLAHLTAVSGSNLAIVCGAVLLLLRFARAGPVLSAIGAGAALLGFVVLAGAEPSVLRAAVMGAIGLLALAVGRRKSTLPALAGTVLGLLLVVPPLAGSPGFALSVAATAALVLLAPGWAAGLRARGVPVGLAEALAVPAAAQVATAPLVAALSGQVSAIGVLANALAEPVVAPATVLGVLATLTAGWLPWVAELLVLAAAPELEWILLVARRAAAVPGATFEWPSGVSGGLLFAGVTVLVLLLVRGRRTRWALVVLVLLATAVLVPVRTLRQSWPVAGWDLVACDVGQGDSLVLATGRAGTAVVIDTGPRPAVVDACLRRLGIEHVALVVLTHLHADHVGGLPGVLDGRSVGAVAVGPARGPAWAMRQVREQVRPAGARLVRLPAGTRLRWPELVIDVLGPRRTPTRALPEEAINNASLVMMATTPAATVLLTGDIELAAQARLLESGVDLRADVLKVPHHGSRYTDPRFLRAVDPRLALISVGHGNDYGHPSPIVVTTLERGGATVLRTDRKGDIAVLGTAGELRTATRGEPLRPGTE